MSKERVQVPSEYGFTIRLVQLNKGYVVVDEENGESYQATDLHHAAKVIFDEVLKIRMTDSDSGTGV